MLKRRAHLRAQFLEIQGEKKIMKVSKRMTDAQIRARLSEGHFSSWAMGGGLILQFPTGRARAFWRFRYSLSGVDRFVMIGSYPAVSIADARKRAAELSARVALGYDVAREKQERKTEEKKKIDEARFISTVDSLCKVFFERRVKPVNKHSDAIWFKIEKNIIASIGGMKITDVRPVHIDTLIQKIVERGANTVANAVLSLTKRIFDYAVTRHFITVNPASAFSMLDAGGSQKSRSRWLAGHELVQLFEAMRVVKRIKPEVILGLKISLALCCRKMELFGAQWHTVDFEEKLLQLSSDVKNGAAINIPLAPPVLQWLTELKAITGHRTYLVPAITGRVNKPVSQTTVCNATDKLLSHMPGCEHFTPHDLRRTARTHLSKLGVSNFIAERCLNHVIKGVEGIYDRNEYIEDRRHALELWANVLIGFEQGEIYNVTPLHEFRKKA